MPLQILDLQAIFSSLVIPTEATRTLLVGPLQTAVTFVCDTGAEVSLIRDDVPGLKPSGRSILVVGASGKPTPNPWSKKCKVIDEDGTEVTTTFVLSPHCPVNLLGRDLLVALNLSILADGTTLKVSKMDNTSLLVLESPSTPTTFYALDLTTAGPSSVTLDLLAQTKSSVPCHSTVIQTQFPLHVTILFPHHPVDHKWLLRFHRLRPSRLHIKYLLWGPNWACAVTTVQEEVSAMMPSDATPHVTLARSAEMSWQQLNQRASAAEKTRHWEQVDPTTFRLDHHYYGTMWKRPLGWTTTASPTTHLSA